MDNNAEHLYNQGYYYYSGSNGYPLNHGKAFEFFMRAAQLNFPAAMNYVGLMYDNGQGVPLNKQQAIMWFTKAYKLQDVYATYNLGLHYYNGDNVPKNLTTAYNLFLKSYNIQPNPESALYIGEFYLNQKKYNEAYKMYEHAAKKLNLPVAWYNMGYITEHCMNTSWVLRISLADDFYTKAAELGFPAAMDAHGRILLKSDKTKYEGIGWIKRAAQAGYEPAKKRLNILKFSGNL